MILCRKDYGRKLDSAVFPGCQGTSPVNVLAAKAVIFKLAGTQEFAHIQKRTLDDAVVLASELAGLGYRIVSGGTDNHQVLVDVTSKGFKGDFAEKTLESVGIILNRNVIPRDADNPGVISGIRLGTSALATRGMGGNEMGQIAGLIDSALVNSGSVDTLREVSRKVEALAQRFPVYA